MAMSHQEVFRNYLYRLRTYRGYSQKQLAGLLGLHGRKAVSDFEAGRRLPSLHIALALEIVLGTKLSEIYPDLYKELSRQTIDREDRLPARFSRHIRGRVLGKNLYDYPGTGGSQSLGLPPDNQPSVRGVQYRLAF